MIGDYLLLIIGRKNIQKTKNYQFSFVETPRKFIIPKLSIRKLGSSSDEDSSLQIDSFATKNLRDVSTKLS